jgi:hypothetical protein
MTSFHASRLFAFVLACSAVLLILAPTQAHAQQQGAVTITQVSSGRLLTAHSGASHDFRAVTRDRFHPRTTVWIMTPQAGGVYTFQQVSTGRFLDAHEIAQRDFHLVTRPRQTFDRTQLWRLVPRGSGIYEVIQVSSGRYMDAHEYAGRDFGVVSRPRQNNATQLWRVASYLGNIEF